MLNFTVGPVMSPAEVLSVSSEDAPYFRTPEFSEIIKTSESVMLRLLNAPMSSRCIFLTASGTGAMESAVMNVLTPGEPVTVINGGSFGQRFADMCRLHGHKTNEVMLEFGRQVSWDQMENVTSPDAGALLVNMGETSSGILYDMPLISEFCRAHGLLLVVDAISAFIADELDMSKLGADVVLTGSQKALSCHPGVSIVAMSSRAVDRVWTNPEKCMYLSLKEALSNADRGQTPWTPAVTTLLEVGCRLRSIFERGIETERVEIATRAATVRECLSGTRLKLVAENPSNAVSAFWCPLNNAGEIVSTAKQRFDMWLCPNGGKLADRVFRIGHIGSITDKEMDHLCDALQEMAEEQLF